MRVTLSAFTLTALHGWYQCAVYKASRWEVCFYCLIVSPRSVGQDTQVSKWHTLICSEAHLKFWQSPKEMTDDKLSSRLIQWKKKGPHGFCLGLWFLVKFAFCPNGKERLLRLLDNRASKHALTGHQRGINGGKKPWRPDRKAYTVFWGMHSRGHHEKSFKACPDWCAIDNSCSVPQALALSSCS